LKKIMKTAVTVELTPAEMILINAYRDEHDCSRMEAIRSLIRGANEEQRMAKEMKLFGTRIDAMAIRVDGLMEIMQQLVSAVKDIRLGTAFTKIALEEFYREDSVAMERVKSRYESFKR
jgi:hypothetical protein